MKRPIYLDHHATTPCDLRVVEAMIPFLNLRFGNPSSTSHFFGHEADDAVQHARTQIADLIGASPEEIIFTSGATESDNMALKGTFEAPFQRGKHFITSAIEHKAVIETIHWITERGGDVTWLPVEPDGYITPAAVKAAIRPDTALVSVMHANHEVGTINPIAEIGEICKSSEVLFHTDAAQSCGKLPIDVTAISADLISISAHKLYGPKGIGALYVRNRIPRVSIAPLLHGGGQERGLRSGTLPTHQIVGFGKAAEIARHELQAESARIAALRDFLQDSILQSLPDIQVHGRLSSRLPGNLNIGFLGVKGNPLIESLADLAVSNGSACTSGNFESSYVLRHLGIDEQTAFSSLRFGVGRFNTPEEMEYAANSVIHVVRELRGH